MLHLLVLEKSFTKKQNVQDRVVSFASKRSKPSEKNYLAHKLEFLALKWSTTQKFHHYQVYGANLEVYADNNPLTYMLTTAKLDAIGHCWLAEIVNYNFQSNITVAIKCRYRCTIKDTEKLDSYNSISRNYQTHLSESHI